MFASVEQGGACTAVPFPTALPGLCTTHTLAAAHPPHPYPPPPRALSLLLCAVAKRCKVIEQKAADFKEEMEDLFRVLMMRIPKQIQNMPMAGLEDELGLGKGAKKGSADENDASMAPPPTVLRSTRNRGRTGGDAAQKKATSQAKDSAKSVAATPSRRATRQSARFGAGAGEPETPMFDPRLPETPAMGRARRGQTIIGQASDEGIAVQLEDGTLYDGKSSVSGGCPWPGRPRRRPHPALCAH